MLNSQENKSVPWFYLYTWDGKSNESVAINTVFNVRIHLYKFVFSVTLKIKLVPMQSYVTAIFSVRPCVLVILVQPQKEVIIPNFISGLIHAYFTHTPQHSFSVRHVLLRLRRLYSASNLCILIEQKTFIQLFVTTGTVFEIPMQKGFF